MIFMGFSCHSVAYYAMRSSQRTLKRLLIDAIRYALSGGVALGVDIGVFFCIRFVLEMDIIATNVIARASGALVAFLFNYYVTFTVGQKTALRVSASRYLWLWLISTTATSAILYGLASTIDSPPLEITIKISVEIALVVINFCACKFWVYKLC